MKKQPYHKQKMVYTPDKIQFQVIESSGISITFSHDRKKNSPYVLQAFGDDDIGMIVFIEDFDKAKKLFDDIKDGITIKQLKELGFKYW